MQNREYHLEHYDRVPEEYEELLYREISNNAFLLRGLSPMKPFSIFIKSLEGSVVGGVLGTLFYGSLYIDSLWVDQALRKQGWGSKLMEEAEAVARKHSVQFITLNTMDWEACSFYEKHGFVVEFIREGYEKESKMFLLRKNL